jgi:hypothetical protein
MPQPPIRKRSSSRRPLGKPTPNRQEKIRKHPMAIPKDRRKETRILLGASRTCIANPTINVERINFRDSKMIG